MIVFKLCESKSQIIFYSLPKDDPVKRRPDVKRAKEKLAWQPKISLDQGLSKTIEDFKKRLTVD